MCLLGAGACDCCMVCVYNPRGVSRKPVYAFLPYDFSPFGGKKKKKTLFKMEVQTFIVLLLLFSEYRILQNTACLYLEPEHCLYHLKRGCGIIKALVGR